MGNVDVGRHTERRGERKGEIGRTFSGMIRNEMTHQQYQYGMPVISTTGPNLLVHWDEFRPILGKRQRLYVVESDYAVHGIIEDRLDDLGQNERIRLFYGDIFDITSEIMGNSNSGSLYVDADLMRTYHTLKHDEGLLDKLYKMSCNLSTRLTDIWLTLTFCWRQNVESYLQQVREIKEAWYGNLELRNKASYRVGAPMITYLFKDERR